MLGHRTVSTTTQGYMRPKAESAREAAEEWGQKVAGMMDPDRAEAASE